MSNEAYMRGFVNRCLERGVDPELLCKHAEAVAGRLEKKAGIGSILRGISLSRMLGGAKRLVPFKGSMMKHPVRWGAGAILGGGATAATLGSDAMFGRDKAIDGRSIMGGAAIGGSAVLGGLLVGDLVARRIREKRKQKALADAMDRSTQETEQLPGMS